MSKVEQWIACDLRYVAETKLGRLTDDELARLYFGLSKKHGLSRSTRSRPTANVMTEKLMQLKKEIQVAYAATAAGDRAQSTTEADEGRRGRSLRRAARPRPRRPRPRAKAEEGPVRGAPGADGGGARSQAGPRGARGGLHPARGGRRCGARAAPEAARVRAEGSRPSRWTRTTGCACAASTRARCAWAAPTRRTSRRADSGDSEEHEGTHKGAELAQKWLTLAAQAWPTLT